MPGEPITLRYVVLRHEGVERPHFDLLFETSPASALAAWRADRWPVRDGDLVQPLPDHRRIYLDYEGPVSGNRGSVRRVLAGAHEVLEASASGLTLRLEDGSLLQLPRPESPARVQRPQREKQ
jgi:hypothetical protein